jgi:2-polyprenyl-3-methyl-5-hydroxy-6-metoxy-1,4-benzoquinol methylase
MSNNLEVSNSAGSLQEHNRSWWNKTPMSYDWRQEIQAPEGSREFFEEVDKRFYASSSFYRAAQPFGHLIPFERLKGKRVLEIGCGLGLHSQLITQAGARLTSIDLTPRAVGLTRKRMELKGLAADVRLMDAENMEFEANEFDFVWSWGVIHHSANTERITSEVFRILKPGAEFRAMVYHTRSVSALGIMTKGLVTGKFFKGMSKQDVLNYYSDGFSARYYSPKEFGELLSRNGFAVRDTRILGMKSELVPIPSIGILGRLKYAFVPKIPNSVAESLLSFVGGFLFVTAEKPS